MQQSEYCQINPMQLIVQVCAVISFPTFIFNLKKKKVYMYFYFLFF